MGILLIVGDRPGGGKTSLAGALLSHFSASGQRVAYYKPFSQAPDNDCDATFFARHLLPALSGPDVPACQSLRKAAASGPLSASPEGREVRAAVAGLSEAAGLVVVEGPDLAGADGDQASLARDLAGLLNARVLLLFRYARGLSAATVAPALEPFTDRLAGVAINAVTVYRRREVAEGLVADLRAQGVPVLGAIPEDRGMLAVTVQEIADHLGARWVQEPVNADVYVDRFLIGGNLMDSGVTYFGRYSHQAVITRAERPDIQLASLITDTRCLILTGGAEPTEYVQVEAMKRDVPLLLVEQGTQATAEALAGLLKHARPHSMGKVRRFTQLAHEHLDLSSLAAASG